MATAYVEDVLLVDRCLTGEPAATRELFRRHRGRVHACLFRVLGGMRALALHDYIVSRRLPSLAGKIDVVHTWPNAALQTLKVAKKLGITTVLERPNTHTRFAYTTVQKESERLGIVLPPNTNAPPTTASPTRSEWGDGCSAQERMRSPANEFRCRVLSQGAQSPAAARSRLR